jgi:hypothetical protein
MKNEKLDVGQNSDPNQPAQLLNTNSIATCHKLLRPTKKQKKMSSPLIGHCELPPRLTPTLAAATVPFVIAQPTPPCCDIALHLMLMPSCYSCRRDANPPTPPYNRKKFTKLKGLGATYISRDNQTCFFASNNLIWISSTEMC